MLIVTPVQLLTIIEIDRGLRLKLPWHFKIFNHHDKGDFLNTPTKSLKFGKSKLDG